MKVKVKMTFYDSVAKIVRKTGDVIDIPVARFNEIRHKGDFVEAVEESAQAKEKK